MTFEQQRDIAIKLMINAGLRPWRCQPPLWRLLWRLGLRIPPRPFIGEWPIILTTVSVFALIWAPLRLVASLFPEWFQFLPLSPWLLIGLSAGAANAALNAHWRHKHGLPTWRDLQTALVLA